MSPYFESHLDEDIDYFDDDSDEDMDYFDDDSDEDMDYFDSSNEVIGFTESIEVTAYHDSSDEVIGVTETIEVIAYHDSSDNDDSDDDGLPHEFSRVHHSPYCSGCPRCLRGVPSPSVTGPGYWRPPTYYPPSTASPSAPGTVPQPSAVPEIPKITSPDSPSSRRKAGTGALRILIIEGGKPGFGEISQLKILQELSWRLDHVGLQSTANEIPPTGNLLLSDYFDVIVGEGFGGMIAVLAAVFDLTIGQIMQVHDILQGHLFSTPSWTGAASANADANVALLRELLGKILDGQTLASSFTDMHASKPCRVFIHGLSVHGGAHPITFSTHVSQARPIRGTVVDVLTMCLSDGTSLPPLGLDTPPVQFVGCSNRFSNPTSVTMNDVFSIFGRSTQVACIVSIGALDPGPAARADARQVVLDAHKEGELWERRCEPIKELYSRFYMSSTSTEENYTPSYVAGMAHSYLADPTISDKLEDIANCLNEGVGKVTIGQLVTLGEEGAAEKVLRDLHAGKEEEQLKEVYEWLCPNNKTWETLEKVRRDSNRADGSGKWFLETSEYKSWLNDPSPPWLFVLEGPPGVGKTYLSQLVYDSLISSDGDRDHPLAHIIKYGVTSADDVVGSLLSQCYQALEDVSPEIRFSYKKLPRLPRDTLLDSLEARLESYESVTIVIDGIDELPVDERGPLLEDLLDLQPVPRLFVSSRPSTIDILESVPTVRYPLKRSNPEDLRSYIHHNLNGKSFRRKLKKPGLKEHVEKVAVEKSSLFLLSSFHLESVSQCRTPLEAESALESLPATLAEKYQETLERVQKLPPKDYKRAMAVFKWIFYAREPEKLLNLAMLVDAVASFMTHKPHDNIEDDRVENTMELLKLCGGLLVVEGGTVGFVHGTVSEFFNSHEERIFGQDPHSGISSACLTYLVPEKSSTILYPAFHDEWKYLSEYIQYCAIYCAYHAHKAKYKPGEKILDFLQKEEIYNSCCHRMPSPLTESSSPLHFLSYIGEPALIRSFPQYSETVDKKNRTPLHLAASSGSVGSIKELLLLPNVKPNAQNSKGKTPLMRAAHKGHTDAVSELLSHQPAVDPNAKDRNGKTALFYAAWTGRIDVIQCLLAHGADANAVDAKGCTPLICICDDFWEEPGENLIEVVSVLVKTGHADVNARDRKLRSALWHAQQKPSSAKLVTALKKLGGIP